MPKLAIHPSGLNTAKERARALRWLSGLAEKDRERILTDAFSACATATPATPYVALLGAIRRFGFDTVRRRGFRAAGPEQFENFQRVRESRARNLRNERPSPLRDKVLHRWALVRELHGQGLGFRLIARYFSKQLRISVSASYLRKMWRELEPATENGQPQQ
ncbi:hypothetical protein SAMN04488503_0949 [Humidesulfovibrio mexicanus]|uniref:Uncharacterized protein n=1 Tax=Humidesulfovibrio mexicanus TaxID=147047 RepID=A0A238YG10_9BACT|nr:hypothetical protein [Humidesulfovibrio mexicanus]SNR70057.1 hypothetical protein SAMN04488503_0949 [Humidesulfovibrio mexicanus]